MKSSCISHPANERLVIIRKWQVAFCEGNQCGAALLSFFEYWHSWKLNADRYNRKSNDIAEMHREPRLLSEDVYQYHSLNELSYGILHLYGEKKISESIKLLEAKSAISIHANPNPKFHYDKTQYFKFYPEVCNEWIKSSYKSVTNGQEDQTERNSVIDTAKMRDAVCENAEGRRKNTAYRTEINNKEINKLNESRLDYFDCKKQALPSQLPASETDAIVSMLIEHGMPAERLIDNPDLPTLTSLIEQGATKAVVLQAYQLSVKSTAGRGRQFGLRYLTKVIDSLLHKVEQSANANRTAQASPEPVYENDFSGGLDWMGDLVS